jgi:YD repeat-containing protein
MRSASSPDSLDQTLGYTGSGNIAFNSRLGSYTYPPASGPRPHAPLTAGPRAYTYDANGNTLSDGVRTFVRDGENRLASVINASGTVSFTYAPDGTRLKKTTAAGTTYYPGADSERDPSGRSVRRSRCARRVRHLERRPQSLVDLWGSGDRRRSGGGSDTLCRTRRRRSDHGRIL